MLAVLAAYADVSWRERSRIVEPAALPQDYTVAVVFGAAVYPGGRPSPVLTDRVLTAVDLYHQGRVRKLLLSGDNRLPEYNEPAAMWNLARQHGVPDHDLLADYAGRRTYDTCWRARHVFGLRRVVLVTQGFHLPRALYLCRSLGLEAVGVPADRRAYRGLWWFGGVREAVARLRAWWDVHVWPPPVVGGGLVDPWTPQPVPTPALNSEE